MPLLLATGGFYGAASASYNDAPTLVDSDSTGITPGVDPIFIATSGFSGSWAAGMRSHMVISTDTSATIASVAGDGDDTGALIDSHNSGSVDLYDYLMTVNGGAVDTNWAADMSATARAAIAGLLFSDDAVGVTAYGKAASTGGPFTAPAIAITGGPRNVLAVHLISVQGSHVTNPPVAPADWSLVLVRAATTNNPTLNDRSTLAIATRTYLAGNLIWTGAAATIAATAWTGLSDASLEPWCSMGFAVLS